MIFFCKQKTSYEMRISDWSSDVWSSDLLPGGGAGRHRRAAPHPPGRAHLRGGGRRKAERQGLHRAGTGRRRRSHLRHQVAGGHALMTSGRSEEHTSELQSLMRISYAVFCLKKKKHKNNNDTSEIK